MIAVVSVALAAGQTVDSVRSSGASFPKGPALAADGWQSTEAAANLPKSAAMAAGTATGLPDILGITQVAAAIDGPDNTTCTPTLAASASEGAMIDLVLAAPCYPGGRVVIRHSGLSFTARTDADGSLALSLPALESDALVAAYFDVSNVALAKVAVPEAAFVTRFAVQAVAPVQFDLRAVEDGVVYAGSVVRADQGRVDRIITLGSQSVPHAMVTQVYTYPAGARVATDLTVELRITAETCSRTFPVHTVLARSGTTRILTHAVAVPLCGTAGDILVLNNLVPAPTLSVPN